MMPITSDQRFLKEKFHTCVFLRAVLIVAAIVPGAVVDALHDGILPPLFGFNKGRIALTQYETIKPYGWGSLALLWEVQIISNQATTHRLNSKSDWQAVTETYYNTENSSRGWREPPRMIIIGGPASGKGTQCDYIASRYGVVHLSTGDILRETVRRGSETGKIAKGFMDRGELVPDEVMINIVSTRLDQDDCKQRGWILDGYPRTRAQASHLQDSGIVPDLILLLDVPDRILIERVTGRRLDPKTGKIYHLLFCPPPVDITDRLEQRSDDTVAKAERRLHHFHSNLSEIRSYIGKDAIIEVDGTGSPDDVSKRMTRIIHQKMEQRINL